MAFLSGAYNLFRKGLSAAVPLVKKGLSVASTAGSVLEKIARIPEVNRAIMQLREKHPISAAYLDTAVNIGKKAYNAAQKGTDYAERVLEALPSEIG